MSKFLTFEESDKEFMLSGSYLQKMDVFQLFFWRISF